MSIADLKDLWWLLVVVIGGTITAIFRIGWKAKAQAQRTATLEGAVKCLDRDISQIIIAEFAILDGLRQLNCNGQVTEAHQRLQSYLASRE